MTKTMPISEIKTRLPELVSGVAEREEEIVVTRNGKPAAVLINYDEYERLKETLDVLSDPISMRQIAQSKRFYAKQRRGESFESFIDSLISARASLAVSEEKTL
jgi:prevent-host-death family protein